LANLTLEYEPTAAVSDFETSNSNESVAIDFPKRKLDKINELLQASKPNASAMGQPSKPWAELSQRSKSIYINRATDTIVSALDVITPGDAANLWEDVLKSQAIDKALGFLMSSDSKTFIEALAEAYKNAGGWDTRHYVLSLMSDCVTFTQLQTYIPGITRYHFNTASVYLRSAQQPLESLYKA